MDKTGDELTEDCSHQPLESPKGHYSPLVASLSLMEYAEDCREGHLGHILGFYAYLLIHF